jgi:hypothetical protein
MLRLTFNDDERNHRTNTLRRRVTKRQDPETTSMLGMASEINHDNNGSETAGKNCPNRFRPNFQAKPPGQRLKCLSIYNTVVVEKNTNILSGRTEQCPITAAVDKGDGIPA